MTEWSVLLGAGLAVAVAVPLFYYRHWILGPLAAVALFALWIVALDPLMGYPVRREPVENSVVFGAQEDVVMAREPGDSPRLFRAPETARAFEERAAAGEAGPMSVVRGQDGERDMMPFTPEPMMKEVVE